jgi:A/G-specific adenine glycosylase
LAWRATRDPYRIWVSEIMLQQTQVATVSSYYPRFIAMFPNIASLAAAAEEDVLRQWEGLGYYRRARQMHRAARLIESVYGGRFPSDIQQVRRLPGIGRYTAGAIASIAYDAREPILEANTLRLLTRLLAYKENPRQAAGQALLWNFAEELLPRHRCGELNQALMELGSLVCRPREPRCDDCPVRALCPTCRHGLQESIPLMRTKTPTQSVHEAAVVVRRRGRVLLMRRGDNGRWAGMWDFPRFAIGQSDAGGAVGELVDGVAALTGIVSRPIQYVTTLMHTVTRFRIRLDCHLAEYVSGQRNRRALPPLAWVAPAELVDYPLSVTGRKLARMVANVGRRPTRHGGIDRETASGRT